MLILTIRPRPAAIITGTAARAIRNGPLTLVSITIRQTSGSVSPKWGWLGQEALADIFHPTAGVVDEHIEPAEALTRHRDNACAVFVTRHIGEHRNDPVAPGFLGDRLDFGRLARCRRDDPCARRRKPENHRPAEPATPAGDDCDLARESLTAHRFSACI